MSDIAREANVNRMTVSRALSRPDLVASGTLERINDAIARTGYVPDQIARGMKTRKSRIVSLLTPPQMAGVYGAFLEELSERLLDTRLILNLYPLHDDAALQTEILREIVGWRPGAIVLVGAQLGEDDRALHDVSGAPVIELLGWSEDGPGMQVGYNQQVAARMLIEHLIARGYRRIGYVHSGRVIGQMNRARYAGVADAIAEAGGGMRRRDDSTADTSCAPWPDGPVAGCELQCRPTFRAGHALMAALADGPDRPDALLFGSDMVAVGALQFCLSNGLRPRHDIGLCGFDGIALTTVVKPGLTTLDFPYKRVIEEGARRIAASIDTPDDVPDDLLIPVRVVPRDTT